MTTSNSDPNRRSAGSLPDDGGNGSTKQKIKDDARDAKREVGARAREKAEAGKHGVADGADTLSDAIDAAASSLDDHDREGLARYARELSGHLSDVAGQIEGRSVDELAKDAKRLARNNPALFMLGSIGIGFGLSRFFKASSERDHQDQDHDQAYRADAHRDDDIFRDDAMSADAPLQRGQPGLNETNTNTPHNGDGRNMP